MPRLSKGLPTPEIKYLTSEDFQFLCFDLAREWMAYGEPIPDYSTRDNNLLESALAIPKQTFGGQLLYPTLIKQASALFYALIKNHPFRNGNKRIAVMGLLGTLGLNKKWVNIDPDDLYDLACSVSESDPKDRDKVIVGLEVKIEQHLTDFPNKSR